MVETRAFLSRCHCWSLYVKWQPYYGKAFTAAETHSMVNLSLRRRMLIRGRRRWITHDLFPRGMESGGAGRTARVVIQVLIPRDWLLRTLGQSRFRARCWERCFRCRA